MAASQIWAWRFFRRIHLPSLERGNEEGEDEGNKENAEGIQASGEGLGGFISIDNNTMTTSTSNEAWSNTLSDHSIDGKRFTS